ncbi:hypothetical protein CYMTET_6606 [Cymbomonas tetramitiformis]|uniref:VWFD domain-containing protein n=1 Tax=Cymbomonas tetramitiformis TaxID=36881 RepID=A0AAE0GWU0_9CHLO|nr:hypothetical protein CYMTET_6606 [Cymbomonas tetramitiformis]
MPMQSYCGSQDASSDATTTGAELQLGGNTWKAFTLDLAAQDRDAGSSCGWSHFRNILLEGIGTSSPTTIAPSMEPPPPYCRSTGDPHFRTFSGRRFDFHGLGEYALLNLTGGAHPMQLHACQQDAAPRWTGAAANTMLAIRLTGPNSTTILVQPQHPAPGVNVTASPIPMEDLPYVSVTEAMVGSGRHATTRTLIALSSGLQVATQSWGSSRGGATKLFLSVYVQLPRVSAAREEGVFHGEGLCGPVDYDGAQWYDTSDNMAYDSASMFARWKVTHEMSLFRTSRGANLCTGNGYFEAPTRQEVDAKLREGGVDRALVERQCAGVCADKVQECVEDAALTGDVASIVNESLAACGMGATMEEEIRVAEGTYSVSPTAAVTTASTPPIASLPPTSHPAASLTTPQPSTAAPLGSLPTSSPTVVDAVTSNRTICDAPIIKLYLIDALHEEGGAAVTDKQTAQLILVSSEHISGLTAASFHCMSGNGNRVLPRSNITILYM